MREHLRTGSLICPGLDVLFFLFLFLLMLPLAIRHVSQSRAVEGTGTVRPLPGAQEAGFCPGKLAVHRVGKPFAHERHHLPTLVFQLPGTPLSLATRVIP